jgi:hypothetical protein
MNPFLLFVLALFASTQQGVKDEVSVPKGEPVVIDGRLSPAEWNGAFRARMTDGSEVLLKHDGNYLYLAVRGASEGFPSLCVAQADTIHLLHASAALASAAYVRSGATWSLARKFGAFALRSPDLGPAGKAAQAEYLRANRWVASNEAMNRRDHEMQIALTYFDSADRRLALGVYKEPDASDHWPASAIDGCTSTRVVQGWLTTDPIAITTSQWARIVLAP